MFMLTYPHTSIVSMSINSTSFNTYLGHKHQNMVPGNIYVTVHLFLNPIDHTLHCLRSINGTAVHTFFVTQNQNMNPRRKYIEQLSQLLTIEDSRLYYLDQQTRPM